MIDKVKNVFVVANCFFPLILCISCSSNKYDSWSECMANESKNTSDSYSVGIYCESNYEMSIEEKMVIKSRAEQIFNKEHGIRPKPPKVGQVEDGYRYEGGDPSNPGNWTPVE